MARQRVSDGVPYGERPSTINGVHVSLRQPAYAPHPHPAQKQRMVETRGVTHVLLEDGSELYECDPCLKTFPQVRSVIGHLPAHNPDRGGSMYSDAVLRHVIRLVEQARVDGIRGYLEHAAEQLNRDGRIKTVHGGEWTPGGIHHLYSKFKNKYPVRVRRSNAGTQRHEQSNGRPGAQEPRVIRRGVSVDPRVAIEHLLNKLQNGITQLRDTANQVAGDLADIRTHLADLPPTEKIDPEIAKKAAAYDKIASQFKI